MDGVLFLSFLFLILYSVFSRGFYQEYFLFCIYIIYISGIDGGGGDVVFLVFELLALHCIPVLFFFAGWRTAFVTIGVFLFFSLLYTNGGDASMQLSF